MSNALIKVALLLSLFVFSFGVAVACDDDDSNASEQSLNIVELAQSNDDLSILVDALIKADLVETVQNSNNITVFAPTNDAFVAFLGTLDGIDSLDDFDTEAEIALLRNVLLNHVVGAAVRSTELSTGYVSTSASGPSTAPLSMYINTANGVRINGVSSVVAADVEASNGVVHVVDAVIGLPTIVTFALADSDNFSSLVAALTRDDQPDFVSILSGNEGAPFTVFAPVNAAFAALLDSNAEWNGLGDIPGTLLTSVLQHHVIGGANVLSSQLSNNLVTPATLEGDALTVQLPGSNGAPADLVDGAGNNSSVVAVDVQAVNGVIHAIGGVLIPNLD